MSLERGCTLRRNISGVRTSIKDVTLHADAIHRGGGQIIPTARPVVYASVLIAEPRLLEPVYLCEITVPEGQVGGLRSVRSTDRATWYCNRRMPATGNPMFVIKACLPINESFGE